MLPFRVGGYLGGFVGFFECAGLYWRKFPKGKGRAMRGSAKAVLWLLTLLGLLGVWTLPVRGEAVAVVTVTQTFSGDPLGECTYRLTELDEEGQVLRFRIFTLEGDARQELTFSAACPWVWTYRLEPVQEGKPGVCLEDAVYLIRVYGEAAEKGIRIRVELSTGDAEPVDAIVYHHSYTAPEESNPKTAEPGVWGWGILLALSFSCCCLLLRSSPRK